MSEQTIDVARLRGITKRARERIDKERAEARARQEAKEAEEAEKYGKETAQEIIEELPSMLTKAAREGRNGEVVIRIRSRSDQRAAEIIAVYCQENGLQTEIQRYIAGLDDMDTTHDHLLVSW